MTLLSPSAKAFRAIHSGKTCLIVMPRPEAEKIPSHALEETIHALRSMHMKVMVSISEAGAVSLVHEQRERIHDVFFVRKSGGLREGKKTVSLIDDESVRKILTGTHDCISADDDMLRILQSVEAMLPTVGKVVVTDDVVREIDEWDGAGSLFYDRKFLGQGPLKKSEWPIIDAIIAKYVTEGIFRRRSGPELVTAKEHHRVLRVKDSPLSGFTLYPHSDGTLEFSLFWSGHTGNGAGKIAARHIGPEALRMQEGKDCVNVFSLTSEGLIPFHVAAGFTYRGKVSDVRHNASMPAYVQSYSEPDRDPHVLTMALARDGATP